MRFQVFSADTIRIPKIYSIGYAASADVTWYGPGQRNFYIIHYIIEGTGYFNGHKVTAGQGFLIRPHDREVYFPDKKDPWKFLWVISTDNCMEELFCYCHADKDTNIFFYPFKTAAKHLAEEICQKNNARISTPEMTEMFSRLFKYHLSNDTLTDKERYFDFAAKYIEANLHTNVTVRELTILLGISQPYLFKIFKEACGLSPKEYIEKTRLLQAKRLLDRMDLSIAQIADALGYSDRSAFSKAFKKATGIAPVRFRRNPAEG